MRYFEDEISGIDGSTATFVGYCLDNSSEIDPNRKRPSVLVIPGGGYEMTSDREAEPIAMQFLAAGFNAFVLRYSVKPSIFPVALLEAAEAMRRISYACRRMALRCRRDRDDRLLRRRSPCRQSCDFRQRRRLAAHGYDADAVRPNGLDARLPCGHVRPARPPWQFRCAARRPQGRSGSARRRFDSKSIIDAKTPPVFVWHTVPDDCVPYENTLMLVDACKKAGVSVEAHLFPQRRPRPVARHRRNRMAGGQRHRTVRAGLAGTCDHVDASYICGYRRCHDRLCHSRRDCRIIAIPAVFSASFHVFLSHDFAFRTKKQVVRHLIE